MEIPQTYLSLYLSANEQRRSLFITVVVAVVVVTVSITYLAPRSQVVTVFAGIMFGVVSFIVVLGGAAMFTLLLI
jgi:hypothetical protein